MKGMRKLSITATAMVAAAVMALAGCGSSGTADSAASGSSGSAKSDTFMAAGLFPLTGSMAYLGPANIATMKLAQKDINAAGGVLGKDIEITSAKVPMISSGATSTAFSGLSDYFFRTIPPDTVQGAVLGQIIAQDGVKNLAIAVFNDEYGTSLRDVVVKTVEDAGVNVVYGEKDTFDPTETNFSSMVTAIKATNPDATLVIAFDQTVPLVKELAAQGLDTHKLYMTDGNTVDHSADFDAGLLKGSTGTIPGAHPTEEFQKNVKSFNAKVTDFTYTAETYDAIVLAALAAQKGGATDGTTVQKNLMAVSGSTKGKECDSYKACLALLKDGKEIQYKGQTSIGAFNDAHDPSSASIGVYKYDADNKPVFDHSQEGSVPKA